MRMGQRGDLVDGVGQFGEIKSHLGGGFLCISRLLLWDDLRAQLVEDRGYDLVRLLLEDTDDSLQLWFIEGDCVFARHNHVIARVMKHTDEIKRLRRRFNLACEEDDRDAVISSGLELLQAIKGKPKLTKGDQLYLAVVENMVILMKTMEISEAEGLTSKLTPEQREMLPFQLIDMIVKTQKRKDDAG